ncbi:MAG: OmpA family protein [Myxococcales bacterium]|nr:OmpA family protein [Myxococcales bacterium]
MRYRVLLLVLLAVFADSALAQPASTNGPTSGPRGIDPVANKPSPAIDSFLTLSGTRTGGAGSYQLDLWLDYNMGLLAFQLGDEKLGDLIQHRIDLHLQGAVAVTDWLELAAGLPLTAYQVDGFDELEAQTGFVDTPPSSTALGDLRLMGRAAILRDGPAPLGLAFILEARGLTGDAESFVGENGLLLFPRLALEKSLGDALRLTLEAGYRYRTKAGRYLNLYTGDEFATGLGASYKLPTGPSLKSALIGELQVSTQARAPFTFEASDALKTPMEALVGWRAQFGRNWHFTIGAGRGIAVTPGYGREALRVLASIRYAEVKEPGQGDKGGNDSEDNDSDGVLNIDDRCPDEAGAAELDGCPDRDVDGIPDVDDECPDEPGVPKSNGCPPSEPLVVYREGELMVFGAITFDSGQDTILEESFPVLDMAAQVLKDHPEITKVRVDGHTDSIGGDRDNLQLSDRRAAAVKRYLNEKGIAAERLESQGFGETEPVDSNATALGRAKNRRVAFTMLETSDTAAAGGEEAAPAPEQGAQAPAPAPAPAPNEKKPAKQKPRKK